MSSSVFLFLSLDNWSLRYCSAVMDVLVMSHQIFVTHTLYEQLFWLWSFLSIIVPTVHACCPLTELLDPIEIEL